MNSNAGGLILQLFEYYLIMTIKTNNFVVKGNVNVALLLC